MYPQFENCKVLEKGYDGLSGKKICIIYNNEEYMLKFPSNMKEIRENISISYSNTPICEYASSHIYNSLGFKTHKTILGSYKNKIVVACRDFTQDGYKLTKFSEMINQNINDDTYYKDKNIIMATDINFIMKNIREIINYDYLKKDLINHFWDMFIVDYLIDNGDRNNGNWGVIKRAEMKSEIAPIYDNGNSFRYAWSDDKYLTFTGNEKQFEWIMLKKNNVFTINGEKVIPYDLIKSGKIKPLNSALKRIMPIYEKKKDEIKKIISSLPNSINGIECCSNLRKECMQKSLDLRVAKALEIYNSLIKVENEKDVNNIRI